MSYKWINLFTGKPDYYESGGGGISQNYADLHYLKLDQIIPQSVINGIPVFDLGINSPSIYSGSEISIRPSGDNDDYFKFSVISGVPTIATVGSCNLKITASSGLIDFEDDNLITTGSVTVGTEYPKGFLFGAGSYICEDGTYYNLHLGSSGASIGFDNNDLIDILSIKPDTYYYNKSDPSTANLFVRRNGATGWQALTLGVIQAVDLVNIGADTQVIFRDGAIGLAGNSQFTFAKATGILTAKAYVSNIAVGTSPIQVTSTTLCSNLNADKWDSQDLPALDSGKFLTNNGAILSWATVSGGYTNLTSFVDQTAWRSFYSNGSGDVTELAFGASGKFLMSNGASSAPTWETFAVGASGSDTWIQFNDGGTNLGSEAAFTYNKTTDTMTVKNISIPSGGTIMPVTNNTGDIGDMTYGMRHSVFRGNIFCGQKIAFGQDTGDVNIQSFNTDCLDFSSPSQHRWYIGSVSKITLASTKLYPYYDDYVYLGDATHQWKGIYTLNVDFGTNVLNDTNVGYINGVITAANTVVATTKIQLPIVTTDIWPTGQGEIFLTSISGLNQIRAHIYGVDCYVTLTAH